MWALNDPLPSEADVIAVISYGATCNRLTNGSEEVVRLAEYLNVVKYPDALVVCGSFSKNPDSELEYFLKKRKLPGSIHAGPVSSSTDECEAIKNALASAGKSASSIVVVAEGAHSRRCKRVWKYMFPNSRICFRSICAWRADDRENPMQFQRHWQVWLLVNIAADFLAYRWKPILRFLIKKNFSQPVS